MANKENLPFSEFVERFCENSLNTFSLERYMAHVDPLGIQARGKVLIIGSGPATEEVIVIEPDLERGNVTSLELINGDPMYIERAYKLGKWPKGYPRFSTNGLSYRDLVEMNPRPQFDTIMFIGTPMSDPYGSLDALSQLFEHGGSLYVTVDGRLPEPKPEIEGCSVQINS